jgi:hypothetical protein
MYLNYEGKYFTSRLMKKYSFLMLIDLTHHSLSFPLAGNLSLKKDCGQAAMTEEVNTTNC